MPAARAALVEFTSALAATHHMQLSAALSSRPSQSSLFDRLSGREETDEDVTDAGVAVLGEKKKAGKAKVLAAYEIEAESAARALFWGELSDSWLKRSSASSMPLHDARQYATKNRDVREESIQWQARDAAWAKDLERRKATRRQVASHRAEAARLREEMQEHSPLSFLKRSAEPPSGGAWRIDGNEDAARRRWRLRHDPNGSNHTDAIRDPSRSPSQEGAGNALPSLARVASEASAEDEEDDEQGEPGEHEEEDEDDWDLVETTEEATKSHAEPNSDSNPLHL